MVHNPPRMSLSLDFFKKLLTELASTNSGYLLFGIVFVSLCQKSIGYLVYSITTSILLFISSNHLAKKPLKQSHLFMLSWINIPLDICLVAAVARFLSHIIDFILGSSIQAHVVRWIGQTPFLDTFPDFLAGGISMIPAAIIGCGIQSSRTLEKGLNAINLLLIIVFLLSSMLRSKSSSSTEVSNNNSEYSYLYEKSLSSSGLVLLLFTGFNSISLSRLSRPEYTMVNPPIDRRNIVNPTTHYRSQSFETRKLAAVTAWCYKMAVIIFIGLLMVSTPSNRCGDGLFVYFTNKNSPMALRVLSLGLSVTGLAFSCLVLAFPLHQKIYELASRNLISKFFTWKYPLTDTNFFGCITVGFATSMFATMLNISELVTMAFMFFVFHAIAVNIICLTHTAQDLSFHCDKLPIVVQKFRCLADKTNRMLEDFKQRSLKIDNLQLIDNETCMDIVQSDVEDEDIDKAFEKYRKTNNINNSQKQSSQTERIYLFFILLLLLLVILFAFTTSQYENYQLHSARIHFVLKVSIICLVAIIFTGCLAISIKLGAIQIYIDATLGYLIYLELIALIKAHALLLLPVLVWMVGGALTFMYRNHFKVKKQEQRVPAISTISS